MEAVKQDLWSLKYIKKKCSEDVCVEAIKRNGEVLQVVKKQSDSLISKIIDNLSPEYYIYLNINNNLLF
jgi:hypothetical protein